MADVPAAIRFSGYHPERGLLIALVLSEEAIARLLRKDALAFDLNDMGLPKGQIVIAYGADPAARSKELQGLDLGGQVEDVRAATRYHCPECDFVSTDAGRCPNDGRVLAEAA